MIILTFIYALSGCIISNNMSCVRQVIYFLTCWKYFVLFCQEQAVTIAYINCKFFIYCVLIS